ncbi:GTP-binding protein Rheb homolog [Haliotis cracherodii]|uniref:GTP-binding protein Rheb homolog n=1 Tax=Haliotis cracherodii TaxID=6455 RepID=UPI0039E7625A
MNRESKITLNNDCCDHDELGSFHIAVCGDHGVGKRTLISKLKELWKETVDSVSTKTTYDAYGISDMGLAVTKRNTSRVSSLERVTVCDAYLLVYSLTDAASFQSVVAHRERLLDQHGIAVPIVFVANKVDIAGPTEKVDSVTRDLNITCQWEHGYVEVSAEDDVYIYKVIEQLVKHYTRVGPELRKGSSNA